MFYFITSLAKFIMPLFIPRYLRNLFTHYLILNKEIEILKRQQKKRIEFTHADRIYLLIFSNLIKNSRKMFKIIQPETLLKWQKKLIKKFWTFKTDKRKPGRPSTPKHIRELVLQMKNENIFWGCRKISNEMRKIGIEIDKVTVWRILKIYRKQGKVKTTLGWSKFLKSHAETIFAMDFFIVDMTERIS